MKYTVLILSLLVFNTAWGANVADFKNQCSGKFKVIENGPAIFYPGLRGPDRISMHSKIEIVQVNKDCQLLNSSKNIPVPEVGQVFNKTYSMNPAFAYQFTGSKINPILTLNENTEAPDTILDPGSISIFPDITAKEVIKPALFPFVGDIEKFKTVPNIGFVVEEELPLFEYLHSESYHFGFSSEEHKIGGKVDEEAIYGLVAIDKLSDSDKYQIAKLAFPHIFVKDTKHELGSKWGNPFLTVLVNLQFQELNFFSKSYLELLLDIVDLSKEANISISSGLQTVASKINHILMTYGLDQALILELYKDYPILFDDVVTLWGSCDFGECFKGHPQLSQSQMDELIVSYHQEFFDIKDIQFYYLKKIHLKKAAQEILSNSKQAYTYSEISKNLLQEILSL